jgi:hypothetical protein
MVDGPEILPVCQRQGEYNSIPLDISIHDFGHVGRGIPPPSVELIFP